MSSVSLQSVSKSDGRQVAVRKLDLEIAEGEFVVFLGPSGCGKTTTLRMIAGFVDPSAGRILLGGRDVTNLPPRKRDIGMVFQSYALFPNMKVRENVAYGLRRRGVGRVQTDARVDELLEMVQLSHHADHRPDELSGGQQQRVALARALAHTPKVLLMDEPFGALDMKLREQLQDEIQRIQKKLRITTIFVTHDQHEAMALADRIVLMDNGEIRQEGSAADVYLRPESEFAATFVGKCNLLDAVYVGDSVARLSGGEEVMVPGVEGDCREGGRLRLSLRPEAIRLAPADKAGSSGEPGRIRAEVVQRRFLGNIIYYRLRTRAGQDLLAEGRDLEIGPGAEVDLSLDASRMTAFAKQARRD
jgi:ABC-type Fe3+/spermidine/putrescine transport system ATPase subunit